MDTTFTPKRAALQAVITMLNNAIRTELLYTDFYEGYPPAFRREVIDRLVAMHNEMLDMVGIEGQKLPSPGELRL